MGGALVSQGVLDHGISEHFPPGGRDEMTYGKVPLAPLIFMDDLIHGAGSISDARIANERVDKVVKSLNLSLNQDKTSCLCMGSKKQKDIVRRELEVNPLMCGGFETKLKEQFKWLGQILSSGGLSESVAATIQDREGKIRGACLEISQIINDWRSQAVGGMDTALLLWEVCCIPSLLHGAGTWTDITEATEKKLNAIQNWYFRLIYQVGPGASLPSLLWDTISLDMKIRVWIEKILLILSIRNLEEDTIANLVYKEQRENNWPGLALETTKICHVLKIEDCNTTYLGKNEYKKILLEACHRKNKEDLQVLARGKCERIKWEKYEKKKYISNKTIHSVRMQFRTRFGLQRFGGNYSMDKSFAKTNWMCKCLESREVENHLISGECKVYGDLALKYSDLADDDNLVNLFTEILARRDLLDKKDNNPVGGEQPTL
jgi:hypothetical protein